MSAQPKQAPRFTKLNIATHNSVLDERTGLKWAVNVPALQGKKFDFAEAQKAIQALNDANYLGHSNWRLPTVHELFGLVGTEYGDIVYDKDAFPDMCTDDWYWTGDAYPRNASCVFVVHFYGGHVHLYSRSSKAFCRPVASASQ